MGMSEGRFLDKLLDGERVEWKALGEIVNVKRGRRVVKSQLEESGRYAVYQNCLTPLGYYHEANVRADTAFVVSAGAAGEIGYSFDNFWAADDVYFLENPESIQSRFLYHFLLSQQKGIVSKVRRASIPRLSRAVIDKMLVPIPCPENPEKSLKIQAEIVRILDAFTELTTELTARKKQYNYYRERLLTFEEGEVEWQALGDESFFEIANRDRRPVTASERIPGTTPYYGANNIQDYVEGETHRGEFILEAISKAP